jgi:tetratricopeptide (TPR) repeat protein
MASIISGFKYDIFISYRQKDNKGERWVSKFVESLKTELESTFKEEVSVYFDVNPHDGLLETHDVDASLKEKLRCLIFIPVISRTYCDPKSFAWVHEFKAFVENAHKDEFGLKISLPTGNVASRVLPVRIHDLDVSDNKLCESVLGSVLRGVDFVYRSPGVNRPLRDNEDNPQDNLNKTYYRDQVNKLGNAIEEIIDSLKDIKEGKINKGERENVNEPAQKEVVNIKGKRWKHLFGKNQKKKSIILLMLFLLILGVFSIFKITALSDSEKTTALILFQNEIKDSTLNENADILLDAIREKLQNVKRIALTPRISSELYRNTKKPINTVLDELHADNLVAGSVGRESNKTIIRVELIKAKANKPAWFKKYPFDRNQIIRLSNEIVLDVTSKLNIDLSSEEKNKIERSPTKNDEAYENLLTANGISNDAWLYYNMGNKLLDSTSSLLAIKTYDKAIKMDSLFALAYAKRAIARSWGYSIHQLDDTHIAKCREDIDKALRIDKDLTEAQIALGFYFFYCKGDYENALKYFKIAADQDPENYQPMFFMAIVYRKMGEWERSQNLIHKVVRLNPQEALFLTNIGLSYDYIHNYDSALIYHQKAINILPGWKDPYGNKFESFLLKGGNIANARMILDTAVLKTGKDFNENRIRLLIYEGKYKEAFKLTKQSVNDDFDNIGFRYIYLARISNFLNNSGDAEKYYDSALVVLNHNLFKNPKNASLHSSLGIACAGTGHKEKAIKEGKYALDLVVKNEIYKSDMRINLAEIYTMLGEFDKALEYIEELLRNPSDFSTKMLQLDPVWKPLAIHPKFKSLIRKYSDN